jgi:hypothetical protein
MIKLVIILDFKALESATYIFFLLFSIYLIQVSNTAYNLLFLFMVDYVCALTAHLFKIILSIIFYQNIITGKDI